MTSKVEDLSNHSPDFHFEEVLWRAADSTNPVPLDAGEIIANRLAFRKTLIDAGLSIPEIETSPELVRLALNPQLRRLTDRGAVIAVALGEAAVVNYVNAIPDTLSREDRIKQLWPKLRDTKIIALRAALQRESAGLPLLQSDEEHSRRRGAEQLAADMITISLQSPAVDKDTITHTVDKINQRIGKHLLKEVKGDKQRRDILTQYFPPNLSAEELDKLLRNTSQLQSPDAVLTILKDIASIPTSEVASAFSVDDIGYLTLLGNDVKPPKSGKR